MSENDRRGVFVSWSKPIAAEIAKRLKPFLEDVLGTASIFMSQAMEGGTRWSMEIPQRLQDCNAGLILVTSENSKEPWLHFEAGALSKQIDESRVIPLLCGASVGDIQGTPLSLFQAKVLNHDDLLSVCVGFGAAFGVGEDAVRRRFEKSWSELEKSVTLVTKAPSPAAHKLELPDLMAVLERIAGQVSTIEASMRLGASSSVPASALVAGGMFGAPTKSRLSDLMIRESTPSQDPNITNALAYLPELSSVMQEIARQKQSNTNEQKPGLGLKKPSGPKK